MAHAGKRTRDAGLELEDEEEENLATNNVEHIPGVDSVCAICQNSHFEVGMACLRLSDFSVELSQFCDDGFFSKATSMLTKHEPRQLLFTPQSQMSVLERISKNEFPMARIEHVPRRSWSWQRGLQHLVHYSSSSVAAVIGTDPAAKWLCLSALACVIEYVEGPDLRAASFVKGTLRIKYASAEGFMLLDYNTIQNLEILRNHRTGCFKASLYGVMNRCKTAAGARMLRSCLIQPYSDVDTIQMRLEATNELLRRDEMQIDVAKILFEFKDCDRMLKDFMQTSKLSGCARARACIASVLHLKAIVQASPNLAAALTSAGTVELGNELLCAIHRNLVADELGELADVIKEAINEDATWHKRAGPRLLECLFALKDGEYSLLDACRQTLGDSTDDMRELVREYHETLNIDIKLNYNERRGYHFVVPMAQHQAAIDAGFIRLTSQTSKRTFACSSTRMSQLNHRAQGMIDQILVTTETELGKLLIAVRQKINFLFRLSESVAMCGGMTVTAIFNRRWVVPPHSHRLDVLLSFCSFIKESGSSYCMPKIDHGHPLVLRQSRHPLLERLMDSSVVPNDVCMSVTSNFQIVTGPNMAGKSTYLRQTAMICLIAHIGCHVPAEAATLPLLQRIFTRVGASDSLETNGSTFSCEMRETNYILRNLVPTSLVLVDELGRGTSNRDGASLAWAVSEKIALTPNVFCLFATHYLQLSNMKNMYAGHVKLLQLSVERLPSRLIYLYKIEGGVCTQHNYMTDFLASMAGLPASVCQLAQELSSSVHFDPVDTGSSQSRDLESYNQICEQLVYLKINSTLDGESKTQFMRRLQDEVRSKAQRSRHKDVLTRRLRPSTVERDHGSAMRRLDLEGTSGENCFTDAETNDEAPPEQNPESPHDGAIALLALAQNS